MAATPKPSRALSERLGKTAADDLVELLNHMYALSRGELQQLNETNFVRFDARMEQRVTQLEAKLEQRIGVVEARLEAKIELRFGALEAKLEQRAGELRAYVDQRFGELRAYVDQRFAELSATLERGLKEQTRWMFVAWATLLIPIIGLWMRG